MQHVTEQLPEGDFFPVHALARILKVTRNHVINLIDEGELKCAIDLRSAGASRSLIRVPRAAVLEILEKRVVVVVGRPPSKPN